MVLMADLSTDCEAFSAVTSVDGLNEIVVCPAKRSGVKVITAILPVPLLALPVGGIPTA